MSADSQHPPHKKTILVIDDDRTLLNLLEYDLQETGYRVLTAEHGQAGFQQFCQHKPDLVLLDINMPGIDGWETCRRIREVSDAPIIMLTAQAQQKNIIKGLDLGADDYMVKPFDMAELGARIRANLRRVSIEQPPARENVEYSDDFLSINLAERRVVRDGKAVKLTRTEWKLLAELVRAVPRVPSHRALLENVWGIEYVDDIDYLRIYIWHLRNKIEPDPKNPTYIVNEQGVGYRFEKHKVQD